MAIEKQSISPEKAIDILKKHGTVINNEQAQKILHLMYKLAKLALNQHFK
jgi:hypothetical protein